MASQYELPSKLGKLFAVMAEDYGHKGNSRLRDLLQKSEYSVEEGVWYDQWNAGTSGHAVHFQVPGDIYFEIIDNLAETGTELRERANELSTARDEFISEITIEIKDHPHSAPQLNEPENAINTSTISKELRQDIFDFLQIEKIHWSGHMDETEFLQRLYDLSSMKSSDNRYPDAAGDIWQHRVNNPYDWDDDWIFSDSRFDLLNTSDDKFLRFICEMMHPVVRQDVSEVKSLLVAFNNMLSPTGWQIVPTKHIGDRPVFSVLNGTGAITSDSIKQNNIAPTADTELDRIWSHPGFFRVFLSHKADYKVETAKLKEAFLAYGVTCFVAHEDIEPTHEWQNEIENALFSMEACVVLLTPGFHSSFWTDHEIGVAIGRRVPVIPVKLGIDPYGFIGKYQAVNGQALISSNLASTLFGLLMSKYSSIKERVIDVLVMRFENAESFSHANNLMEYLKKITVAAPEIVERLDTAPKKNMQVREANKVKRDLPGLLARLRGELQ